MELDYRPVSRETYEAGKPRRIQLAALVVDSMCILREIDEAPNHYAVDLNVRVTKISEPNEVGRRSIELVAVNSQGEEVRKDGVALGALAIMGADSLLRHPDGTEDGYFVDSWDMGNLGELTTSTDMRAGELVSVG